LCDEQNIPYKCKSCGWNPEVARRRKWENRMAIKQAELEKEENKKSDIENAEK
jgi:hypothetical protein